MIQFNWIKNTFVLFLLDSYIMQILYCTEVQNLLQI